MFYFSLRNLTMLQNMLKIPLLFILLFTIHIFIEPVQTFSLPREPRCKSALTATAFDGITSVANIKTEIQSKIQTTSRGLTVSPEEMAEIDSLVKNLETRCPYTEPARMPTIGGKWIVNYTTAPPPSNGKLGPFVGVARQIIDLDNKVYTNYLSVPGDIDKEWLSARLEATFEEWDGTRLDDDRAQNKTPELVSDSAKEDEGKNWLQSVASIFQPETSTIPDYGADSWKVDFKTLTIKVFGFQLLRKTFDEGTSRVWKMTYLDDEGTRIGKCEYEYFYYSFPSFPSLIYYSLQWT